MVCPKCGSERPPQNGLCPACGAPRPAAGAPPSDAATALSHAAPGEATTRPAGGARAATPPAGHRTGPLAPGQEFGPRYRILKTLGAGGMGAVYQAWDEELGVAVALKVILPEALADPQSAQEVERRFKRELLLARQVTHRNVVRIHDLGEVEGVKYLTMPFIQGEDVAHILKREGKLPIERVLSIAKQVASGLAAAHEKGIVHRDLKPENIMIDADGTAVIMDFGISRSVSGTGTATALGTVMGTLEYMSPEQAQGQAVDQRADIYAFGLILYDLIGGRWRASKYETPMSELMARLTQPLPPIKVVAPDATPALDAIITKCLQTDPARRYQTTTDLLRDLENLDANGHPVRAIPAAPAGPARKWTYAAAALALVAVAALGGAWWLFQTRSAPQTPAAHEPVTVLIANFDNQAKDPVFDGLIEQALGVGVEGASFVNAYPRRDALRLAAQMPGGALDLNTAKLISIREGIRVVLGGSIASDGQRYRLTVTAVEAAADRVILDWNTTARDKDDVLPAVGKMSARVRQQLGDTTTSEDTVRAEETFTARSLDAAKAYVRGQELQWAGKQEEALAAYKEAVTLDPELGRAYAGLGAVSGNLGRRQESERYYQEAFKRLDRMTDREKYRTRGPYFLITQNSAQALEELQKFVKQFPADSSGLTNLAYAYFLRRDFKQAMDLGRRASEIFPKNAPRKNNVAFYALYAGDFAAAEAESAAALGLSPQYLKAFVASAQAQLAQGRPDQAAATYRKLEQVSAAGRTWAITGLADLAMYEGRLGDAEKLLGPVIAEPGSAAGKDDLARWLVSLGYLSARRGDMRRVVETSDRATSISADHGVLFLAARNYIDAGQVAKAQQVATTLGGRLNDEPQIYAKLIQGEIAFKQGRAREAVQRFQEAQKIGDSWLGHYDLGRAFIDAGEFAAAYSEFEACLKRRGEATAIFLDDYPTYRFFAPVHYYLGRAQEGLGSPAAAESYKAFLAIKEKGEEQGIVADARKRLLPQR
jgi:tetratricopeptide (TPR) repeat protein/tRNA A-37 threonylcarbamoyl transferase component Bud32